jgi:lipopolysaccharide/colanic/teichoic acid biosynthesis glycosyltransferase
LEFVDFSGGWEVAKTAQGDKAAYRASVPPDAGQSRSRAASLALKRTIDVIGASVMLAFLMPVLIAAGAVVRLESRGPALFTQIRWGRNGTLIRVYKFRTMHEELCDKSGIMQTMPEDPRVTRFGRLLRKTSIDELPQFWNVLRGDMSLVGPRCHPVGMLAGGVPYEELVSHYHSRHQMRPGMTGLAQMRGLRGPTTSIAKARARIACDLHYAENFSIWLDLKIVLGTIASEFKRGKGF